MTKISNRLAWALGLFTVAAGGLWACGGGSSEETSVFVVVNNGPVAMRPEQVQIDVYKGTDKAADSLERAAAAGMGARLGDLVIYPPVGLASIRIAVFGKTAGEVISSGLVDVAIQDGTQVTVEIVLAPGLPMGDAGVLPADAGSQVDGASDASTTGPDVGTGDASAPKLDAMVVPKKTTGAACVEGAECASGSCLQQVCCDKACDGKCNSCKAAGAPVGQCTPIADGTKCGEPACGGGRRTLIQYACMAGACEDTSQNCATRSCDKDTLTCQ